MEHTYAFPHPKETTLSVCTVLNCENTSAGRFTTHEKVFMETAACAEHLDKLRSGEQWSYGEGHEILMGSDLPPLLQNFKVQERVGTGVTLVLEAAGKEPYSVWVPDEFARTLGSALGAAQN